MEIIDIIKYLQKKYEMKDSDITKTVFQHIYGCGHLITDISKCQQYLEDEIVALSEDNESEDLYDYIGNNYVRLNLSIYKKYNLDFSNLLKIFLESANIKKDSSLDFKKELSLLKIPNISQNMTYSHSQEYKEKYHPHYRVVDYSFLNKEKVIQLLNYLKRLKGFNIVALDGKCGAGKTTISKEISKLMDITVLHCDDFFLPKAKKTQSRLQEIGGNIDYELIYENLKNLSFNKTVTIKCFDCTTQNYYYKDIYINNIVLLEGVYSTHPYFREFINHIIYYHVSSEEQNKRLQTRHNYQQYINEWCLYEQKYFDFHHLIAICDLII